MAGDTDRSLGRLEAGLVALQKAHDDHALTAHDNFANLTAALKKVELELAGLRGERRAVMVMRHTIQAALSIAAGMFGAHVPLPH